MSSIVPAKNLKRDASGIEVLPQAGPQPQKRQFTQSFKQESSEVEVIDIEDEYEVDEDEVVAVGLDDNPRATETASDQLTPSLTQHTYTDSGQATPADESSNSDVANLSSSAASGLLPSASDSSAAMETQPVSSAAPQQPSAKTPFEVVKLTSQPRNETERQLMERLPNGWLKTLDDFPVDKRWIARDVFGPRKSPKSPSLKGTTWWVHPPAQPAAHMAPNPVHFFAHKIFLFFPVRFRKLELNCSCGEKLIRKGIFPTLRVVHDSGGFYFLGAEYLQCSDKHKCRRTFSSYSWEILQKLPLGLQELFPAVLTNQLGMDKKVLWMLRCRTPGNSPTHTRRVMLQSAYEIHLRKELM